MLLKDSTHLDKYKSQHEKIWIDLQDVEEDKVEQIYELIQYELMPTRQKFKYKLRPFKTHLLWIIPLSVIGTLIILYVIFIWVALIVE